METAEFRLQQPEHLRDLLKQLRKSFTLKEEKQQKVIETYYDTFDWLIYKNSCVLKRKGKKFYLHNSKTDISVRAEGFIRKKFFSWELEEGELRDALRPLSDIRALTEILTIKSDRKIYSLLNRDRKTVVRILADFGVVASEGTEKEMKPIVVINGLRGYDKQFEKVTRHLLSLDAVELREGSSRFEYALEKTDRKALDYSSKYSLPLDPAVNVHTAVSDICLYLSRAMRLNYGGVIEDIDSEFLHDFRIAVRRTRSLLSQMKRGLPAESIIYFQNEFKWLGTITGPVRDIDVYMLMTEEYRSMVPRELHEGLTYFFQDLGKKRKVAFKEMHEGLTSKRYAKLTADWKAFLKDENKENEWPLGKESCRKVAAKIIRKRFNRIIRDGRAINDESPDVNLHSLRIQGKKLRYLLEFFKSFYGEVEIDFFLKQMKKLQNNLGDFNDLSVQQEMLLLHQKRLSGRSKRSVSIASAIGGLLAHLNDEHKLVRQKFEATFSEFASEKNIERFISILV